jgi:hypothetical protein
LCGTPKILREKIVKTFINPKACPIAKAFKISYNELVLKIIPYLIWAGAPAMPQGSGAGLPAWNTKPKGVPHYELFP